MAQTKRVSKTTTRTAKAKIEVSTIRKVWLATLGLFGLMGDDGRKFREELIKRGDKTQKKAIEKFEEVNERVRDIITRKAVKEM